MADLSRRLEGLSPEKRALLEQRLGRSPRTGHPLGAEPVAIIGMGCRFPGGANSPEAFWRLLTEGRDAIRRVPAERWDADAVVDPSVTSGPEAGTRWGGFLDRVDEFDPGFFGIAPREASQMDPQQRLLLEVAWEALEEAGQTGEGLAGSATGVFVGIHSQSSDYYWLQVGDRSTIDTYTASGGAHSIMANRLSYLLDLRGPSVAIDTACSSSLVALHLACQSLRTGDCDMALAGGVNLILSPETGLTYAKMQMLAPDGRCKTFDASADGFVRAEGCGLVVLRRLADALRNRDSVLAVIRGTAVNQDGATNGLTAPNGLAQQAVVRRALASGGVDPEAVGYVETHGTGTTLGDPIEVEALTAVLGRPRPDGRPCVLGAVKANIGHLEAAAGVAGLIKTVLCLRHEAIPPQPHFRTINPHIDMAGTSFTIPTVVTPWRKATGPRIAGVSSFGFGGTNAHLVVEEPPTNSPVREGVRGAVAGPLPDGPMLLPISARSADALQALAKAYQERADSGEWDAPEAFRDLCYTAAVRRSHHDHRLAVAARDARDWAARLRSFLAGEASPQAPHGRVETERRAGPVFVFSGQGPQWPGMGRELLECEPIFRGVIERCDMLVQATAGWSLLREFQAPEAVSRLAETEVVQPALFALQVGLAAMWRAWGMAPAAVVGHSLGEIAAAHVAGALSLEEAVRVVVHRGRIMQQATGRGKMAAVDLCPEEAARAIAGYRDRLAVGAVNAPASTVLSGDATALDAVVAELAGRGVRCQPLPVNYAFHSHQMEPLATELVRVLGKVAVQPTTVPMISTVTGRALETGEGDAAYWGRNVRQPVLFAAAVAECLAREQDGFLEIGPHPVLSGTITVCLAAHGRTGVVTASLRRKQPERVAMLSALGTLYAHGVPVDWRKQHPAGGRCVQLPAYPWQRRSYWIGGERKSGTRAIEEGASDLLHEVVWRQKPLPVNVPSDSGGSAHEVSKIVAQAVAALPRQLDDEAIGLTRELLPELDLLCVDYVCQALGKMGAVLHPGAQVTVGEFAERLQVLPRHHGLFGRLLTFLAEDGILEAQGDAWLVRQKIPATSAAERWSTLQKRFPHCQAELDLLGRCGDRLADVLRGDCDALECIFPDGSMSEAESFYGDSPFSRRANACIRETAVAVGASLGRDRKLRALEIGAGTGGATQHLLPALAPCLAQYVFTDVSSRFLHHAENRLKTFPQVEYRLLDIEREPRSQGYREGEFDLILAANVLHATTDLAKTLRHIHGLLAPGGLLLFLEGTRFERWIDLIFGMTPGWWKFADTVRRPHHPLLSMEGWRAVLAEAGFAEARAVAGNGGTPRGLFEQEVILARAAVTPPSGDAVSRRELPSDRGKWLVVSTGDDLAAAVGTLFGEKGEPYVLTGAAAADGGLDANRLVVDLARPEGLCQLVRDVFARDRATCRGVVVLGFHAGSPVATAHEACRVALHAVQAVLRAEFSKPPRIWLVTTGAAAFERDQPVNLIGQATLWGLGRVVAREHPEIWGGLIDLDPSTPLQESAATILRELTCADGEDQICHRDGQRRVARIVRCSGTVTHSADSESRPVRGDATYLITGGLGGLGLSVARWMGDRGATSLVLVSRSADAMAADPTLTALRERGVHVLLARADVSKREEIADVLRTIADSLPPLRGVIHAAGVLDDGVLLAQEWRRFERVLGAKVDGTWNLHELTLAAPLDFFVLFSSVAALLGPPGQGNHAAANAFQDAVAHWRRAQGLTALCLNWGPWGTVGAAAATGSTARLLWGAQGIEFFAPEEGLGVLGSALRRGVTQSAVLRVAWPKFLAQFPGGIPPIFAEVQVASVASNAPARPAERPTGALARRWATVADADRAEFVLRSVKGAVASILGHSHGEGVDVSRPLMELGVDSLMAVELKKCLEQEWALLGQVPATLIFKYPTVRHIAGFIRGLVEGGPSARADSAPSISGRPPASSVAEADLNEASDDEVKRLLAEELRSLSGEFRGEESV